MADFGDYLRTLPFEVIYIAALAQSLIAMVFSWITMITWNWRWFIPTVLFALGNIGLVVWYCLFR